MQTTVTKSTMDGMNPRSSSIVAAVMCVAFTFLTANGSHTGSCTSPSPSQRTCQAGHPFVPTGQGAKLGSRRRQAGS